MGNLSLQIDLVDIPPMPITVAIFGEVSLNNCCTKRGYLPLTLPDGTIYWQLCFYCANAVGTIISPQAVLASSDVFTSWMQTGFKDGWPGTIKFDSLDGHLTMKLLLEFHDGLYYCPSDVFTVAPAASNTLAFAHPIHDDSYDPTVFRVHNYAPASILCKHSQYILTSKGKQLKSELWLLRLGSPEVWQLDHLPGNATGILSVFEHHPFHFMDFKAQAEIQKQAARRLAVCTTK